MSRRHLSLGLAALLLLLLGGRLLAAVLPEERVDALYHSYDGGGVEVDGPSILLRKNLGSSVSLGLNHYVDNVTSASIDVVVTASEYTEERIENSVFLDYIRNKTSMSLGYTRSEESDYDATTLGIGISQDMFGDLTTVSLGFGLGDNIIKKNGDPDFEEQSTLRSYRLGMSQILTPNLITSLAFEAIVEDGYLNNPYRLVRYRDPGATLGYNFEPEVYPDTRNGSALAVRASYYLEGPGSVLQGGVRWYEDNWGIDATTWEGTYIQPYDENWIFELRLRYHDQTEAEFYSDLFPYENAQTYLARDKELSDFTSTAIGLGASYEFGRGWNLIDRASINLELDWIRFDYNDFRDLTEPGPVGDEPLYSFDAQVTRFFASFWF